MTEIAKIKIKTESHFSNFDRGENIFRVMTLWNSTYVYVCQPFRRGFPASKTIPSVRAGQYINVAAVHACVSVWLKEDRSCRHRHAERPQWTQWNALTANAV